MFDASPFDASAARRFLAWLAALADPARRGGALAGAISRLLWWLWPWLAEAGLARGGAMLKAFSAYAREHSRMRPAGLSVEWTSREALGGDGDGGGVFGGDSSPEPAWRLRAGDIRGALAQAAAEEGRALEARDHIAGGPIWGVFFSRAF